MKNIDSIGHVTGRSVYLDDIPVIQGTLHAVVFGSPCAHGEIKSLDFSAAQKIPGVRRIITSKDIPGENQIGGIIPDEELLATNEVHFQGQPIAIIVAETEQIASEARKLLSINIAEKEAITNPRTAKDLGHLIFPPRTFQIGDTESSWKDCSYLVEGSTRTNGQEHLYIETQGAYAIPKENGTLRISSSTQGPTQVQRTAAKVLGLSMHKIEVDVGRIGGGFGGKEDQATPWAVMAALASWVTKKPVKLVLHRMDDMYMTGKRHPYQSDYKLGLSADLKILAFEATYYQNAGAAADLSPAILERTLFHGTNSYFIPNARLTAYSCKTNLPPNTAFRGFGGPQAMFVLEAALADAAQEVGVSTHLIQSKNLIIDGNEFPYGQIASGFPLAKMWDHLQSDFDLVNIKHQIQNFNKSHFDKKKGYSVMPVTFGISFTKTPMNQARALVHIYSDGSVGISTGAVEMGQGVNTKMVQVAAQTFSIDPAYIKLESTNTTRVANTSPSAASSTADLNGKALRKACIVLLDRLKECAASNLKLPIEEINIKDGEVLRNSNSVEMSWRELVNIAFLDRICLTENGHYATPVIHFDNLTEKGHPFAYYVSGIAITEITLDCLRGIYEIDAVKIMHDFGSSMNPHIDIGQLEGGLVQGIGWMTMEEVLYSSEGKLLSNSLSTYKIPNIYSVPKEIQIKALETSGTEMAILKSKAVGEPPLMYGIGTYFAIENAVRAFNPKYQSTFDAPFTHEKVLKALYEQ